MKEIYYEQDARAKVLSGAKKLYDAVKVTYGPKGKNVIIEKEYGAPVITHDGVTVAEAVDLGSSKETLGEKVGANLIKTAAQKLNKVAGDGTTTVTVLTYNILAEANKLIAAGVNPMELRKEIEKAGADIVKKIDQLSEKIDGDDQKVAEVATISAGDATIGKLIANVISKIGKDGVVTVEAGQGLDKGYASAFFVTDVNRQEAIMDKPLILLTDKKITSSGDILPLLEKVATSGKKDLVIIAEEVSGEALSLLVLNKLKGVFNTIVLKAPAFGDKRKAIMEDLAVLTDATVVSEEKGMKLEEAGLEVLGSAKKVIATKDDSTIIKGAGSSAAIKDRIELIEAQAARSNSDYERGEFEKRKAALSGKVAVIKVGGATEPEIDEKKYRVDDAVSATRAALSEGIVAGGGVTLVNLTKTLKGSDNGTVIVKNALKAPLIHILENAGLNSQALLAEIEKAEAGFGVDVMHPEQGITNLKQAGVIDPARVTREAVQNAISIAATAITMGALIVNVPEPKTSTPAEDMMY